MKSFEIAAKNPALADLTFSDIKRRLEKLYKDSGKHFFHKKFDFKGVCAYLTKGPLSSFEKIHRFGGTTTLSLTLN